jgi:hypothetical protein
VSENGGILGGAVPINACINCCCRSSDKTAGSGGVLLNPMGVDLDLDDAEGVLDCDDGREGCLDDSSPTNVRRLSIIFGTGGSSEIYRRIVRT